MECLAIFGILLVIAVSITLFPILARILEIVWDRLEEMIG